MVSQPSQRRPLIFTIVLGLIASFFAAWCLKNDTLHPTAENIPESTEEQPSEPSEPLPELIDLQPVVDSWKDSFSSSAKLGVEIFDLENSQIVAELNKDTVFPTESLYKLFVVYEGYRRTEQGTDNPETSLGRHTIAECLDLAIRESNSSCAEAIRARIGIDNLDNIISSDFGLKNSSNRNLSSTASDITDMMKIYYEHEDLNEDSWAKIQDSMLNQPPVNNGMCSGPCDWRQGLPSGFSAATKVYNKVGWRYDTNHWASYHDTAIIELDNGRHYIVTVMTSNAKYQDISRLGSMIEAEILKK